MPQRLYQQGFEAFLVLYLRRIDMRLYFSKRHEEALKQKRITPKLPMKLRNSILKILNSYSSWEGYNNSDNWTFEKTEEQLKLFYGEDYLYAYENDNLVRSNLEGVIKNGYPPKTMDAIEAWCDNANSSNALECQKELNTFFEIHNSPWRIANGTFFLVDSQYLRDEVVAKTQFLLKENSLNGPLEEFTQAVSYLTEDQTKEAIVNAHKSIESVMKSILGVETQEYTFGRLLADVIKSGILPQYYEDFFKHFEQLAHGAVRSRNKSGTGHGQGPQPIEIPKSLAEFTVHLAGSINLFLIKCWLESQPPKEEHQEEINLDDLPF